MSSISQITTASSIYALLVIKLDIATKIWYKLKVVDKKTIVLIADYGVGDPAFLEVMLQLRTRIPGVEIYPQSVPPFSTLNTGFWIYQIAMTPNLPNTYIYANTAPRKHEKKAQENNRGEVLTYAKLADGFEIVAVNAGYAFSFVKPYIKEFHVINVQNDGSQFRSRDKFPQGVAGVINKEANILGDKLDVAMIPDVPENNIASIDGYGNIKTTTRLSQVAFHSGQKLTISMNNISHEGVFTDGTFNVQDGELAFAPGSSGHDDKCMEIFYRGGNAAKLFNNVTVETSFTLTPLA
ncbi:SAM-dependent chlorinase/fluorinase [soil metagenome]